MSNSIKLNEQNNIEVTTSSAFASTTFYVEPVFDESQFSDCKTLFSETKRFKITVDVIDPCLTNTADPLNGGKLEISMT